MEAKHELGQNFLFIPEVLDAIAGYAKLKPLDTVLEIGPGMGTLTCRLTAASKKVVAVELDSDLAEALVSNVADLSDGGKIPTNLEVVNGSILDFDLTKLPRNYIIVANIPYNITSKILQMLVRSRNKPSVAVLLVQKEMAERLVAGPGKLSSLAIFVQNCYEAESGIIVPAEMFTPAPKVDSQVVILRRRSKPLVGEDEAEDFYKLVKAGFAQPRKKMRTSLAVGLHISKKDVEELLTSTGIDSSLRPQQLSIDDWKKLLEKRSAK